MTPGRRLAAPAVALLLSAGCVVGGGEVSVDSGSPAASDAPPSDARTGEEAMARAIFDRANAEREQRGVAAVAWNEDLAEVARRWSAQMARRGTLEHQDVRGLLK